MPNESLKYSGTQDLAAAQRQKALREMSDEDLAKLSAQTERQRALQAMSDEDLAKLSSQVQRAQKPGYQSLLDAFETGGRSILESGTLGLSEPVLSGLNALTTTKGYNVPDLKSAYQADVDRRRQLKAEMPLVDIGGQLVGAFTPQGLAAKMALLAGKSARAGTAALGLGKEAAQGAGLLARGGAWTGKVAQAGLEGAAVAGGLGGLQQGVLRGTGFQKEGEGGSVGNTMLWGAGLGSGIQALPAIGKGLKIAGKEIGKTAMTVFLGPKREIIDRYLARAKHINSAETREQIKTRLDGVMSGLFDDVEKGKLTVDEAKGVLGVIKSEIGDVKREASEKFAIARADIDDMLNAASKKLDEAFTLEKEKLTNIKSPIQIADDVQTAIEDLKQQVIDGSKDSYEILERSNIQVDTVPIFHQLRSHLESIGSKLTDQGRAASSKIRRLVDDLYKMPTKISGPQAKRYIQELDNEIKWGETTGQFTPPVSRALQAVRAAFDEQLKGVTEYSNKMAEVAEKTQLLQQLSRGFGTSKTTINKITAIANRNAGEEQELLERLGQHTGRDFRTPVQDYVQAQGTLKDPRAMENIKRGLPGYREVRQHSMAKHLAKRPETRPEFIQGEINKRGLPQAQAEAEARLAQATEKLQQAEGRLKPYKKLTPENTQGKIATLIKEPGKESQHIREMLENLSRESDQNFIQMIDDRRVADAFTGEYRNGSRNVNLWTFMGLLTGNIHLAGVFAALGAITDRFGPQIAKKILDGALKIKGSPTVQNIEAMSLPRNVKDYLIGSLRTEKQSRPEDAISRRMKKLGGE